MTQLQTASLTPLATLSVYDTSIACRNMIRAGIPKSTVAAHLLAERGYGFPSLDWLEMRYGKMRGPRKITLKITPATLARIAETVESHKWSLMQFVQTCENLPSMPGEEEEDARIMSDNKRKIAELRQLEFAIAEILETAEISKTQDVHATL